MKIVVVVLLGILGVLLVGILPSASGLKCVQCRGYACSNYKKGDSSDQECPTRTSDPFNPRPLNPKSCDLSRKKGKSYSYPIAGCSSKDPDTPCEVDKEGVQTCYCGGDLCNDPSERKGNESTTGKSKCKSKASVGGPSLGILIVWVGGVGGIIMEQLLFWGRNG